MRCLELLDARQTAPLVSTFMEARSLWPGYAMWIAVGAAVLVYEALAQWLGWPTMSDAVRQGPRWAAWFIGLGLVWLGYHLYLGGRSLRRRLQWLTTK